MSFNPSAAQSTMNSLDPRELRAAFGHFATGVAIVTTIDSEGRPAGMTISSFNTVSLNPPLILWSIAQNAPGLSRFTNSEHFAVNILTGGQRDLALRFGRPSQDKFAGVEWHAGEGGMPLIVGCLARLECRLHARYPGGDHEILLGEVMRFSTGSDAPLLFFRGQLTTLD